MKNLIPYILLIIISFAFGWFLHNPKIQTQTLIQSDTITIYHDTGSHSISYVPKYLTKEFTKIDTIYIDTNQVINDYFAVYSYDTTIVNDPSLFINWKATVTQNNIVKSSVTYANRRPIQNIVNHYSTFKPSFFIGGGIGNDAFYFGGGYQIQKFIFTAEIGTQNRVKTSIFYKL